jgi:hypothetical protein
VVATPPGLAETLARDGCKAARFYARFGITQASYTRGVPMLDSQFSEDPLDRPLAASTDSLSETGARGEATLFASTSGP